MQFLFVERPIVVRVMLLGMAILGVGVILYEAIFYTSQMCLLIENDSNFNIVYDYYCLYCTRQILLLLSSVTNKDPSASNSTQTGRPRTFS